MNCTLRRHRRRERDRHPQRGRARSSSSSRRAARSRRDRIRIPPCTRRPASSAVRSRRAAGPCSDRGTGSPPRCDPRRASSHFTTRRATSSRAATSAGDGSIVARLQAAGARERVERGVERARPARIGEIAERDQPDAVLRQPAHLRAEARQAAAVRDDGGELAGLRDAQTVAVAAGVQLDAGRRSSTPPPAPGATPAASRAATSA